MNMSIQRDVPLRGLQNTSIKDAWFIQYRPAIRTIITSGNNDILICACTLCVPWMDGCYTIVRFGYGTVRNNPTSLVGKYSAKDVVKFIFLNGEADDSSDSRVDMLANFYNSLKHGGFLRPGYNAWAWPFAVSNSPLVAEKNETVSIDMHQWVSKSISRIDQLLIDATFD